MRKHKKWFDQDCDTLYRNLKSTARSLTSNCNDTNKLKNYYKLRKSYKQLIRKKQRQYKSKLLSSLVDLESKDSKTFWNVINKFKNGEAEQNDPSSNISPDEWHSYFNNLLSVRVEECDYEIGIATLKNNFDEHITVKEVTNAIRTLRNNTCVGFDTISNEMLKNCSTNMLQCICKLFNLIYESGIYPAKWTESIIKPIFKAGDECDPSNYRGIAISSFLSKLFSRILYNRMDKFVCENNILSECQIGFRKSYRTTDHIFTLKSIIDKYLRSKQHVYACFVDLRKAFDTVWRNAMFAKMLKYGINGKLHKVIKSMYSTVEYSVKLSTGLTKSLSSNVGVKQGCILSPLLFNLFLNDLPECLGSNENNPVFIGTNKVNCLMYADDVILLSTSREGLQNCLNSLYAYAEKWKLKVNTEKTQVITFNGGGQLIKDNSFYFGNDLLKNVQEYKYLGVIIKASGNFNSGICHLSNKALKVVYMIRSRFHTSEVNAKLLLKLFDACVKPVLLYGSELWSVFNLNLSKKLSGEQECALEKTFDSFLPEKIHTRYCKYILGVGKYACNMAPKAELGRFPIAISALLQSIKYWLYLLQNPFEKATRFSYLSLTYNDGEAFGSFNHQIGCLLKYLGFSHVWHNKGTMSVNKLIYAIKRILLDRYEAYFNSVISGTSTRVKTNNKLLTYSEFKKKICFENYLSANVDRSILAKFTKLRISNHRLEVEVGRYTRTAKQLRLCKTCNLKAIEDEFHFICICKAYDDLRKQLFKDMSSIVPNFDNFCLYDKFLYIMSVSELDMIPIVVLYVDNCLKIRQQYQDSSQHSGTLVFN